MDEIGKVLPSLFKKQLRRAEPHLLDILLPLWPRIAGKSMAQHSQPGFFASGVLTLNTDSTTWGTQLRHMTEEIRAKVNRFLGQSIVKKLRIKVVPQPGLFSASRPLRETEVLSPSFIDPSADLESISDPELASILALSYTKYFNRSRSS